MQIIDEVVDPQRGLRGSSSCPEEVYSAPLPVVGFVGCPELHDALAKLMNAVGGADYADGAFRILSLASRCAREVRTHAAMVLSARTGRGDVPCRATPFALGHLGWV